MSKFDESVLMFNLKTLPMPGDDRWNPDRIVTVTERTLERKFVKKGGNLFHVNCNDSGHLDLGIRVDASKFNLSALDTVDPDVFIDVVEGDRSEEIDNAVWHFLDDLIYPSDHDTWHLDLDSAAKLPSVVIWISIKL